MKTGILALLLAIAAKFFADELKEWANWLPAKLIRWASKQFPAEKQGRFEEEWLAHCNDLPGTLAKVLHAIGCLSTSMGLQPSRVVTLMLVPPIGLLNTLAFPAFALGCISRLNELYNAIPDVARADRLRLRSGGFTVLGLLDLYPQEQDLERAQRCIKSYESADKAGPIRGILLDAILIARAPFERAVRRLYKTHLDYFIEYTGSGLA